jgi:gluconolactonase
MQVTGVPPADDYSPGFANVEGPVWIDGSLYFSHIKGGNNPPPSRILKLTGSDVSVFLPEAGTNGLAVGPDGKLYGARHSDGAIAQIDLTTPTMSTQVAFEYGDPTKARFNSPNDLAIRSDGNIYFSDPDYQAPAEKPQAQTRVYRVSPTKEVSVVDGNLGNPNGVTLSLEGDALFVTASGGLRHYPVNADGTTGSGTVIAPSIAGDGMGIDCAGHIYATNGQEVVILDVTAAPAMATVVDTIPVTVPNGGSLTNVAFGGPERKTLYITFLGSTPGLFKIDLAVPGMPY